MSHTPGPWEFNPIIDGDREVFFVRIGKRSHHIDKKSDAVLISTAPEMLEVLKNLQILTEQMMGNGNLARSFGIDIGLLNTTLVKMDRLLAKAKGKDK